MNAVMVVVPGILFAWGIWLIASSFRPQHRRLKDALASLEDRSDEPEVIASERLGAWYLARRPNALPGLKRQLRLKGRSVTRHYTIKVISAAVGLVVPLAAGVVWTVVASESPVVPVLVGLVGAAVGFVLPDVVLRAQSRALVTDATEALLTFFDLVTLERLANQSATQSLHAAAHLSQSSVFSQVRGALERARLQQVSPWAELVAVGRDLELPALVDLADVLRLDESGASLAGTLRARVRELRDAHLTRRKVEAHAVSERMTFFMVIPSLIFGLVFLLPPLFRLVYHP